MARRSFRAAAGRTSAALTAVLLAASVPTSARTWLIAADGSGDAPTIQAGIDSAADGDTVFAMPGRFVENIDFLGKAIVVKGSGMGVSIIDGSGQAESCVRFWNGEGRGSVLEGFAITGGSGSCFGGGTCRFGGGIYSQNAQPTIRDNRIIGNIVTDRGGGIYSGGTSETSPLIQLNEIVGNRAGRNAGGVGAANGAIPLIQGNIVQDNIAGDGDGGGIWIWVNKDGAVVTGNQIIGNTAGDQGGGILAALNASTRPPVQLEISYNLISDNRGLAIPRFLSPGGGIKLYEVAGAIHHNTIVGNEADGPDTAWGGGGILAERSGGSMIEQNIIALSTYGSGIRCTGTGVPTIRDNLVWQNVGGDGSGLCATWWQGNGNIVTNPYFCDPGNGVYTLAQNSPAITHVAGPLGAFPVPGCGPVAVEHTTWGRIKTRFESP